MVEPSPSLVILRLFTHSDWDELFYKSTNYKINTGFFITNDPLTELPGDDALQRWVVKGVPAVHEPGARQHLYTTEGQQVGVLQPRFPSSALDASLQGAKAAVLRVAENFDALMLHQAV